MNQDAVIGICGAGAMGAGIAQIASQAGHKVIVLDRDNDALDRGRQVIKKGAEFLLKREKINSQQADQINKNIKWTLDAKDFASCGLVVEAIIEDLPIKQSLYEKLETICGDECIIATNTSSLPVTALASRLRKRERFIGLHFFNPAPVMKLVEIIRGLDSDDEIIERAVTLMNAWGKKPVIAKDVPGFIVNRLARPFYYEGWRAYEEGVATPAFIDELYRQSGGFRMGPLELGDLIGHDINFKAANSMFEAYFGNTRFRPSVMQGQLAVAGRLGRKSGEGVYTYGDDVPERLAEFVDDREGNILISKEDAQSILSSLYKQDFAGWSEYKIGFAQGFTAKTIAKECGQAVILLDWFGGKLPKTFGFSVSEPSAVPVVAAIAKALGVNAIYLRDRPGMIVLRSWLQLANAACDGLRDQIGDESDIDLAMKYGVNYPSGPIAWVRKYGLRRAISTLEAIQSETGDGLYMPSEALRDLARS